MQSAHLANKPDEMQEGYIEEDGTRRKKMEGEGMRRGLFGRTEKYYSG